MSMELDLYTFEQGIPGFEQVHTFVFEDLGNDLPMRLMKAGDNQDVSLLVASPFLFYPEYEWELQEMTKQELNIQDQGEVEVWSVITVPKDLSNATINLLAPIILNNRTKQGKQLILHDHTYSSRAPLNRN